LSTVALVDLSSLTLSLRVGTLILSSRDGTLASRRSIPSPSCRVVPLRSLSFSKRKSRPRLRVSVLNNTARHSKLMRPCRRFSALIPLAPSLCRLLKRALKCAPSAPSTPSNECPQRRQHGLKRALERMRPRHPQTCALNAINEASNTPSNARRQHPQTHAVNAALPPTRLQMRALNALKRVSSMPSTRPQTRAFTPAQDKR
jgi:hypothetical protein